MCCAAQVHAGNDDDEDDEIAYFTVRWKTRASFVYRTKNIDNNDKDSKTVRFVSSVYTLELGF